MPIRLIDNLYQEKQFLFYETVEYRVIKEVDEMKKTGMLTVLGQHSQNSSKIVIHPNDGFDLGLMSVKYPVKIFSNITLTEFQNNSKENIEGTIHLENYCRLGTIELATKYWNKIGNPQAVVLYYDEGRLLIENK